MNRYICVHGHFYQPPRENPWLEAVELQDSAYPYHDWNARITAECYAPNTASRILNPERKIIDIVSNYAQISFNFGPTLLSWLQKNNPDTYQAILDADKKSTERFSGHGSAIAQTYNHMIQPLANTRDKQTQIYWGLKDFEHRFQRRPEGLWLPETAVDLETLEILAGYGIVFTILAPLQAAKVRKIGDKNWQDVSNQRVDPKMPYLCNLPSGKSIIVFFYDGPISQDIAFGGLLENGEHLANRLGTAFAEENKNSQLVHAATDGETYGHHHRYGDMALAYCLYYIESKNLARLTIYGEYLENHPPTHEVRIFPNSSWSCIHGVERWQNDCGCGTGMHPGWKQNWRAPLRGAMDWLRDNLVQIYTDYMPRLIKNPWKARDEYIHILLDRNIDTIDMFCEKHAVRNLSPKEKVTTLKLLEMQRHAMLMYTSCGWFFDDISGIEAIQIMQYAARAIQLANDISTISLEETFISLLERAPSNGPHLKNGAHIYRRFAQPASLDLLRVGEHYALSSLFTDHPETINLYAYTAESKSYERIDLGKQKVAIGKVSITSNATLEQDFISFAVLHLGDHNLTGGARAFLNETLFSEMSTAIQTCFRKGEISDVIRLINNFFGDQTFSIWHLFRDEQRDILNQVFTSAQNEIEASFRQIYEHHYPIMQVVEGLNLPLPNYFSVVVEFIVNTDIRNMLESEDFNPERLQRLADESRQWNLMLDGPRLGFIAHKKIAEHMAGLAASPENIAQMKNIINMLKTLNGLNLNLDLWEAQNIYFSIGKQQAYITKLLTNQDHTLAQQWTETFQQLGEYLRVRIG